MKNIFAALAITLGVASVLAVGCGGVEQADLEADTVGQTQSALTEWGVDRPGMDYRDFNLTAPDPHLCESACANEGVCKAYSYVIPGIQGPWARCWLKYGVPEARPAAGMVSGVKRSYEPDTDRPGQDYQNFDLFSSDPSACRSACDSQSACAAWTYVPPGIQGFNARCWLKSGIPSARGHTGMISGVKGF